MVAEAVGDAGEAMGGVVDVADVAVVRQGDLGQLPHAVVVVGRGFRARTVAHRAAGQPAARRIGQGRRKTVGIDDGQRVAVGIEPVISVI